MKDMHTITHRIPTTQYGYVEVETEWAEMDGDAIKREHDQLLIAFQEKPQNTLPDAEMTQFLFGMLNHVPNHIETYEKMNPAQKTFINQLKKALARKKPSKDEITYEGLESSDL